MTQPGTCTLVLAAKVVSAHLSKNTVEAHDVPSLIQAVYQAFAGLGAATAASGQLLTPAVPIRRSVFGDYIVCLEDGKKLRMLKRHLKVCFGMTPDEYRSKWGLRGDYPMVAPNYSQRRSTLAKAIGFGKLPTRSRDLSKVTVTKLPARRARGSKG